MTAAVIVEDAGVLACGGALIALVLRLLAGYGYACVRRRRRERRSEEALSEPLLPGQQHEDGEETYVMRNPVLRWLRQTCALVLGVAYAVRACTLWYHGKDPTGGTSLVLVGCGWWLLAQVEGSPAFEDCGPCADRGGSFSQASTAPAPALAQSPAWLTLTLGYLVYVGLAVHPLLETGTEGTPTAAAVALGQLCVAALALALLALEAVVALVESRRRDSAASSSSSILFTTLRVPPTPEQTASFFSTLVFGYVLNGDLICAKVHSRLRFLSSSPSPTPTQVDRPHHRHRQAQDPRPRGPVPPRAR